MYIVLIGRTYCQVEREGEGCEKELYIEDYVLVYARERSVSSEQEERELRVKARTGTLVFPKGTVRPRSIIIKK